MLAESISTCVPTTVGDTTSKTKSIEVRSLSETPDKIR